MNGQQKLFSIEEASLQLKIPKYTLRFWEKTFAGILVPIRTKGGQRRFTPENMELIQEIKKLREKGMSLSDVKRELNNDDKASYLDSNKIDLLANRVAAVVKAEVYHFLRGKRKKNDEYGAGENTDYSHLKE